jgi:hypothetical protein
MIGRRRPDTNRGMLPDELQPGDYWKVLDRSSGEPAKPDRAAPSNLTGTVWQVVPPETGYGVATLTFHTVREHEDGTISVLPGDGSSNSILVKGSNGKQWHGYIRRGVWETC